MPKKSSSKIESLDLPKIGKSKKGDYIVPAIDIPQSPKLDYQIDIPFPKESGGDMGAIVPPMENELENSSKKNISKYKAKADLQKKSKEFNEALNLPPIKELEARNYLNAEKDLSNFLSKVDAFEKMNPNARMAPEESLASKIPATTEYHPPAPEEKGFLSNAADVAGGVLEIPAAFVGGAVSSVSAIPYSAIEFANIVKEGKLGTREGAQRVEEAYFRALQDGMKYFAPQTEFGQAAMRAIEPLQALVGPAAGALAGAAQAVKASSAAGGLSRAAMAGATASDIGGVSGAVESGIARASRAAAGATNAAESAASRAGQAVRSGANRVANRFRTAPAAAELASEEAALADEAANMPRQGAASELSQRQATQAEAIQPSRGAQATQAAMQAEELSPAQIAREAKKAAAPFRPSETSKEKIAAQVSPSKEYTAALKQLKSEDSFDIGHATTNEAFRQFDASLKMNPQSALELKEASKIENLVSNTKDVIKSLAEVDVTNVNENILNNTRNLIKKWKGLAENEFNSIKEKTKNITISSTDDIIEAIEKKAKTLDRVEYDKATGRKVGTVAGSGFERLSPLEKDIYKRLKGSEREVVTAEADPFLNTKQKKKVIASSANYNELEEIRKDLTAARVKIFQGDNYVSGLRNKDIINYEKMLFKAQLDSLEKAGLQEAIPSLRRAQKYSATYKGLQDKEYALFGVNEAKSAVPKIKHAQNSIAKGDIAPMKILLKDLSKEDRQGVILSGLFEIINKKGDKNGGIVQFVKHMDELKQHPKAYSYMFSQLSSQQIKTIKSIETVFRQIKKSFDARKSEMTGRGLRSEVYNEIAGSNKLVDLVIKSVISRIPKVGGVVGGAVDFVQTASGKRAFERIGDMLLDPSFKNLALRLGTSGEEQAIRGFANSTPFRRVMPNTTLEQRFSAVRQSIGGGE